LSRRHKRNIRLGNLGRIVSAEQREHLRQINLGKTLSEETKAKLSAAWKPASARTRRRISAALLGHSVSETTRDAIRRTKVGRPLPKRCVTSPQQRAEMRRLIAAGTTISAIARLLGFNRTTVRNVLQCKHQYDGAR
jgi:DNA invertase Pin-like site-specific DNA recombinase